MGEAMGEAAAAIAALDFRPVEGLGAETATGEGAGVLEALDLAGTRNLKVSDASLREGPAICNILSVSDSYSW